MTTYALLIYRSSEGELSEEQVGAALDGHRALQKDAASKGDLHAVAQLAGIETAKTVSAHSVRDGPYIETKEWLVGFYLVDCKSEKEALSRARQICPNVGHVVEVRPVSWRWKK